MDLLTQNCNPNFIYLMYDFFIFFNAAGFYCFKCQSCFHSLLFVDIVTSQPPLLNCSPTVKKFCNVRTAYKLSSKNQMRLLISWNGLQLANITKVDTVITHKKGSRVIKAVATVEPSFAIHEQDGHKIASSLELEASSGVQFSLAEKNSDLDDSEKLRRFRISKANKGNVPWNKGRKHSPETIQRIRERTRLAMQDPKVKMKLVNIGHAQSNETREKIAIGVREGWQRRREKLAVQETCCLEWKNEIAEASRKGYSGEDELQWDSYEILDKELSKEWEQSVENRKKMPRIKGSKRTPKSLEQRRKISEAISAKWADQGYRDRVISALAKYHGIPVGGERKPRKKKVVQTKSAERVGVQKIPDLKDATIESKVIKGSVNRKKKNAAPMYKDPMASKKLEMIKKIKAQRSTEMENKKREATQRAKLLIAEAEKAANALEIAAHKSPLARASLLETRKLIAEATRSIESIEQGEISSKDNEDSIHSSQEVSSRHPLGSPEGPLVLNMLEVENKIITDSKMSQTERSIESWKMSSQDNKNCSNSVLEVTQHPHSSPGVLISNMLPVETKVNGTHQISSSDRCSDDFGMLSVNVVQSLPVTGKCVPSSLSMNNSSEKTVLDGKVLQVHKKVNGRCNASTGVKENEDKHVHVADDCNIHPGKRKKWVCGRLVDVEED